MKFRFGAAWACAAFAALSPLAASAQSADAYVLPWGTFRLSLQGTHESFDSRFDVSGTRVPLAQGVAGDLTPARFTPLRPLSTQLGDFFTATQGGAGSAPSAPDVTAISLGTLDARIAASQTHAPAQLSVGILPRVEIGASIPLNREDRVLQRLALADGNVGANPDPTANGEILSRIGWGPLGSSPFLPTAGSPAGIELQNRATALAGEPLTLPETPSDSAAVAALITDTYGAAAIATSVEVSRAGDAEVFARFLLLSTFGPAPLPVDPVPLDLRVALFGGMRLPTGQEPLTLPLIGVQPREKLSTYHAGATADLFLGSRLWVTTSARITRAGSSDVTRRVAPGDAPLSVDVPARTVTINPGDLLEIIIAPRLRLLESLSIGAEYNSVMVGDTEYSDGGDVDASVLNLEGGGLHRVGLGIRYTSLPAYWGGRAALPAEVNLAYRRTISGPEGTPAGGAMTISASIFPRLWGR